MTSLRKSKPKNQSLIPFMRPVSKQRNYSLAKVREIVENFKFLSNWKEIEHNGWNLPATKEKHCWCGIWQSLGCINEQAHVRLGVGKKIYLKQFQRSCYRPACKECYTKWITRQADVATKRIKKFEKLSNRKPIHLLLSPPSGQYYLSENELKMRIKEILKVISFSGGAIIFHPFKRYKNRDWYYAPHFHIIGFGWRSFLYKGYGKFGWLVKDLGFRESVFQSFCYLLSHSGIKERAHTVRWVGKLSYSKLKVEKEPKITCCPICKNKFMPIYYDGIHPVVPPDRNYEGLLDSDGRWYPVFTDPDPKISEYRV